MSILCTRERIVKGLERTNHLVVDDWRSRLRRRNRLWWRSRLSWSSYGTDGGQSKECEDVGELHDEACSGLLVG